jgi:hypothetical protein
MAPEVIRNLEFLYSTNKINNEGISHSVECGALWHLQRRLTKVRNGNFWFTMSLLLSSLILFSPAGI